MPSATWRTSTACGFSLETSDSMKPNEPSALAGTGTVTLMPEAPHTIRIPARTSAIGSVRTVGRGAVALDDQAAVHLGVLHRRPSGRRCGPGSRGWCWSRSRRGRRRRARPRSTSASPGSTWLTPWICSRIRMPLEGVLVVGGDLDPGVRRVVGAVPDVELVDAVVAAVLVDVVEHLREGCRVDQVSPDLDDLAVRHVLPSRSWSWGAARDRPVVVVVAGPGRIVATR